MRFIEWNLLNEHAREILYARSRQIQFLSMIISIVTFAWSMHIRYSCFNKQFHFQMRKNRKLHELLTRFEKIILMAVLASDFSLNGIFFTLIFLHFRRKAFGVLTVITITFVLGIFYAFLFWKYRKNNRMERIVLSSITSLASFTEVKIAIKIFQLRSDND